ncbi:MAG: c-type cytochrome biogenesis protein CcmI [Methyloglobulus sp.]|nr:c-type cytochrome biogenesis protein CcmI [Methyloglobulus sp.]
MNVVFWLIAVIMILIALAIILPPVWRERKIRVSDDLDQRNIKIARDRLAELKANRDSGGINQSQYDEQVAELEQGLSDDLEIASQPGKSPSQGRWLVYVLVAVIPVLSVGLYWKLGHFQAVSHSDELNQAGSQAPSPEAIRKMVTGLAEKLKAEPNNLQGWLMLGRSYKAMGEHPQAVDAFAHAYQLAGEKADVILPYAEALALAGNNQWQGKPEELVAKALALEPENLNGLWFASMAKAQQGDKKAAIDYLRKLEVLLPPDSPDKKQLHDLIVSSDKDMGNAAPAKSAPAATLSGASLTVNVSLAVALQQTVSPEDTVFIYAQPLSGPKMPLAIIRKQVKDLPLSATLTDAEAMMPNMKLSNFKQVRLLARISKSGGAIPQTGDLIGVIEPASPGERQEYKLVISDQVK